jgi:hypothetical protein
LNWTAPTVSGPSGLRLRLAVDPDAACEFAAAFVCDVARDQRVPSPSGRSRPSEAAGELRLGRRATPHDPMDCRGRPSITSQRRRPALRTRCAAPRGGAARARVRLLAAPPCPRPAGHDGRRRRAAVPARHGERLARAAHRPGARARHPQRAARRARRAAHDARPGGRAARRPHARVPRAPARGERGRAWDGEYAPVSPPPGTPGG